MGGERGFEAALFFLDCARAVSAADGENRKTIMKMQRTMPTTTVMGFERRNERTGPIMAAADVLFGVMEVECKFAYVRSMRTDSLVVSASQSDEDQDGRASPLGHVIRYRIMLYMQEVVGVFLKQTNKTKSE